MWHSTTFSAEQSKFTPQVTAGLNEVFVMVRGWRSCNLCKYFYLIKGWQEKTAKNNVAVNSGSDLSMNDVICKTKTIGWRKVRHSLGDKNTFLPAFLGFTWYAGHIFDIPLAEYPCSDTTLSNFRQFTEDFVPQWMCINRPLCSRESGKSEQCTTSGNMCICLL